MMKKRPKNRIRSFFLRYPNHRSIIKETFTSEPQTDKYLQNVGAEFRPIFVQARSSSTHKRMPFVVEVAYLRRKILYKDIDFAFTRGSSLGIIAIRVYSDRHYNETYIWRILNQLIQHLKVQQETPFYLGVILEFDPYSFEDYGLDYRKDYFELPIAAFHATNIDNLPSGIKIFFFRVLRLNTRKLGSIFHYLTELFIKETIESDMSISIRELIYTRLVEKPFSFTLTTKWENMKKWLDLSLDPTEHLVEPLFLKTRYENLPAALLTLNYHEIRIKTTLPSQIRTKFEGITIDSPNYFASVHNRLQNFYLLYFLNHLNNIIQEQLTRYLTPLLESLPKDPKKFLDERIKDYILNYNSIKNITRHFKIIYHEYYGFLEEPNWIETLFLYIKSTTLQHLSQQIHSKAFETYLLHVSQQIGIPLMPYYPTLKFYLHTNFLLTKLNPLLYTFFMDLLKINPVYQTLMNSKKTFIERFNQIYLKYLIKTNLPDTWHFTMNHDNSWKIFSSNPRAPFAIFVSWDRRTIPKITVSLTCQYHKKSPDDSKRFTPCIVLNSDSDTFYTTNSLLSESTIISFAKILLLIEYAEILIKESLHKKRKEKERQEIDVAIQEQFQSNFHYCSHFHWL